MIGHACTAEPSRVRTCRSAAAVRHTRSRDPRRTVATIDGVTPAGKGGLLGIVVHDDHLYAYAYSTAADGNRIQRFPVTGEPGALRLGEPEMLLDALPAANVHNGGRLAIGPDGMLYATVGDAGDRENAQDRMSPRGSILRMTPDGGIPSDNPLPGSRVFSYGHRNPQGLAWTEDGTMLASEFGQDTWDELNVIDAGTNYGWPEVEGIAGDDRFTDPVQQWEAATASPSGIAIHEGVLVGRTCAGVACVASRWMT